MPKKPLIVTPPSNAAPIPLAAVLIIVDKSPPVINCTNELNFSFIWSNKLGLSSSSFLPNNLDSIPPNVPPKPPKCLAVDICASWTAFCCSTISLLSLSVVSGTHSPWPFFTCFINSPVAVGTHLTFSLSSFSSLDLPNLLKNWYNLLSLLGVTLTSLPLNKPAILSNILVWFLVISSTFSTISEGDSSVDLLSLFLFLVFLNKDPALSNNVCFFFFSSNKIFQSGIISSPDNNSSGILYFLFNFLWKSEGIYPATFNEPILALKEVSKAARFAISGIVFDTDGEFSGSTNSDLIPKRSFIWSTRLLNLFFFSNL